MYKIIKSLLFEVDLFHMMSVLRKACIEGRINLYVTWSDVFVRY